jgi:hypothetical protein
MSKAQKRAFIQEIKVEMRDMISNIADSTVDAAVLILNNTIDRNERRNEAEHTRLKDQFQKEMLIVSEYCKK